MSLVLRWSKVENPFLVGRWRDGAQVSIITLLACVLRLLLLLHGQPRVTLALVVVVSTSHKFKTRK